MIFFFKCKAQYIKIDFLECEKSKNKEGKCDASLPTWAAPTYYRLLSNNHGYNHSHQYKGRLRAQYIYSLL